MQDRETNAHAPKPTAPLPTKQAGHDRNDTNPDTQRLAYNGPVIDTHTRQHKKFKTFNAPKITVRNI